MWKETPCYFCRVLDLHWLLQLQHISNLGIGFICPCLHVYSASYLSYWHGINNSINHFGTNVAFCSAGFPVLSILLHAPPRILITPFLDLIVLGSSMLASLPFNSYYLQYWILHLWLSCPQSILCKLYQSKCSKLISFSVSTRIDPDWCVVSHVLQCLLLYIQV